MGVIDSEHTPTCTNIEQKANKVASSFQAKSLEEANRVGLYPRMDGQVHGRSFEMDNCAACHNDIMQQKLAHYRGETLSSKPTMQRQRKVDGDDIEDAEREQVRSIAIYSDATITLE
jgi:hypothetical protein